MLIKYDHYLEKDTLVKIEGKTNPFHSQKRKKNTFNLRGIFIIQILFFKKHTKPNENYIPLILIFGILQP